MGSLLSRGQRWREELDAEAGVARAMGSLLSRGQRWREELDPELGVVVTANARVGVYLSVRHWRGFRVALVFTLTGWEASCALLLRALYELLPTRHSPGELSRWWDQPLRQLDGEETGVAPAPATEDADGVSVLVRSLSLPACHLE